MNREESRFEVVYEQGGLRAPACTILQDRETGVQYLLASSNGMSGITPLLSQGGKPLHGNLIYNRED